MLFRNDKHFRVTGQGPPSPGRLSQLCLSLRRSQKLCSKPLTFPGGPSPCHPKCFPKTGHRALELSTSPSSHGASLRASLRASLQLHTHTRTPSLRLRLLQNKWYSSPQLCRTAACLTAGTGRERAPGAQPRACWWPVRLRDEASPPPVAEDRAPTTHCEKSPCRLTDAGSLLASHVSCLVERPRGYGCASENENGSVIKSLFLNKICTPVFAAGLTGAQR